MVLNNKFAVRTREAVAAAADAADARLQPAARSAMGPLNGSERALMKVTVTLIYVSIRSSSAASLGVTGGASYGTAPRTGSGPASAVIAIHDSERASITSDDNWFWLVSGAII
ncbi:unnamed protein product [Euphydryas editha]|uniref:Uncharacterized protein n=1 Tax=Euphydryas editha TaxID=104508 RepID=A0AAU9U696_EUPED|nr:unnamed protein product [Euphydryas editha]